MLMGIIISIILILFGVIVYRRRANNSEVMISICSVLIGVIWLVTTVLKEVL